MTDRNDDDAPNPEAGASEALEPWNAFSDLSAEALETLSRNLMEAAATSQSMMKAGTTATTGAAPSVDLDPFQVAPHAVQVWSKLASDPMRFADAQMRLWQGYADLWANAARRMAGDAEAQSVAPEKGDKRWRSEEWTQNAVLDVIKQSYLLTARWLSDTVESVDGVSPETKRQVSFFTKQMSDAFSPTNFALTNPDVLRETVAERGENLLRGMRNLADDIERGGGRLAISQTDFSKFSVGEDVASTPGQVVFRNDIFELIHYTPTEKNTYARPLLIFPPWINKFYILDLRAENSMIRWLLSQGYEVFLTSWVNPEPKHAALTFEDYMHDGIGVAVDKVIEQSGADSVNTVGYCIGGTLLTTALAHMAKTGDTRINSATYFAAQTDFSEAGELMMFTSDEWLAEIERRMDANDGVLDGQTMADTFNMLRANDLIWSFVVNNYLLGRAPRAFDLLFWNSDQTRLGKAIHLFYLNQFYRRNALSNGDLEIGGETLTLSDVTTPVYFQASREDHIAPFRSVYRGARKFSGPVRFTLAGSGHIAGVINHPDAKKYQHWTNDAEPLPETTEAWMDGAVEHPGSWWPDWDAWLSARSGDKTPALDPSAGPLGVIEPAPGSYVKVKS